MARLGFQISSLGLEYLHNQQVSEPNYVKSGLAIRVWAWLWSDES